MSSRDAHILVCEDNAPMATVLRFNLERAGFRVTVGRNGREGWELAQDHVFDLVVTDHQMPELSGAELCQRLRQDERYRHTPLVLLTAKALELDASRLISELQLSAVMGKPFSPAALVEKVRELLTAAMACSSPDG